MEKIILIDGNSIVNRAYFGLPDLTTSNGLHTNGIKGFLNIMIKLINEEKPDYLAIAFDVPEPTFRHLEYKEYKAQRKPMEEALYTQFPILEKLLKAMGVFVIQKGGYEADDLLGTIAVKSASRGIAVSVISGDKDLLQLATDLIKVRIPTTAKGQTVIKDYTNSEFAAEFGLNDPKLIIDLKAIMGDSSDNYKGVEGIGKVGATKLLQDFGSLDGVYEHIDEIKGANHDKLMSGKDSAYFCRWLATIKTDCDIDFEPEYARLHNIFTSEAYPIIKELEFKSLLSSFENCTVTPDNKESGKKEKEEKNTNVNFAELCTADQIKACVEEIVSSDSTHVGFSYAFADSSDGFTKHVIALAFVCGNKGWFAFEHDEDMAKAFADGMVRVCNSKKKIVGFEIKEIAEKISAVADSFFDVSVAAYLLYPGKNEYTVCDIARDILGINIPEVSEVLGKMSMTEALFDNDITGVTHDKAVQLLKDHACIIYSSYKPALNKLAESGMSELYEKVEMPLLFALRDMEVAGVIVDRDQLMAYGSFLSKEMKALEKNIFSCAGTEFNINSPKQLGEILFDKLKLPGGKKTKTGYSTNADELEKLKLEDPIIGYILKYRELSKLKGTYADGMGSFIRNDGRIHTEFNQTVTATGRLSSANPNLQNIPIRKENGREIRRMFVAKPGCVFIDADYSQIELRLLAHMSGDETLIDAYRTGKDIHTITAAKVFGVEPDEVTPVMRSNAKAVNFGIIYGMSSFGLGQEINVSKKEADSYIAQYFETYPTIKKYLDSLVSDAKKTGYSVTLFNRKRPIADINASNFMVRSRAERIAMNSPIQGTAADIMKIALVDVSRTLKAKNLNAKILLQVHDELLIECPAEEKDIVTETVRDCMMKAADLKVELSVSVGVGENWDEAH